MLFRSELKFTKFVGRLRKRFAGIFNDILKTQLILKNIVTPEDWDRMKDHIQYDFLYDNQFSELKETELINGRLGTLASIEPYIGKYYSVQYVRSKILRQTDGEIEEIDQQIEEEIRTGIIPDPSTIDPITGQPLPQADMGMGQPGGGGPDTAGMGQDVMGMGQVPTEPDLNQQSASVDAQMQKDAKKAEI